MLRNDSLINYKLIRFAAMIFTITARVEQVYSPLKGIRGVNEHWVKTDFLVGSVIDDEPNQKYYLGMFEDLSDLRVGIWLTIDVRINTLLRNHAYATYLEVVSMEEVDAFNLRL